MLESLQLESLIGLGYETTGGRLEVEGWSLSRLAPPRPQAEGVRLAPHSRAEGWAFESRCTYVALEYLDRAVVRRALWRALPRLSSSQRKPGHE